MRHVSPPTVSQVKKLPTAANRSRPKALSHCLALSLPHTLSAHQLQVTRAALPRVHSLPCTATLSVCETERECSWTFVKLRYSFRLVCFNSFCLCFDLTWRVGSFYCYLQLSSVACPQLLNSVADCCLRHWVLSRKESKYFECNTCMDIHKVYTYICLAVISQGSMHLIDSPFINQSRRKLPLSTGFSLLFICYFWCFFKKESVFVVWTLWIVDCKLPSYWSSLCRG